MTENKEKNNYCELNGRPLRLLIGGSPCTYWSIAQKNNRETEAEGLGWELFKNYLIAKDKFKPDLFLYENNKSASAAIKKQIVHELGYPLQIIDSALVSAQKRLRFYVKNWTCPLPEDRGILLKDILEDGIVDREKAYCLKHQAGNARDYIKKHHTQVAFKPVRIGDIGTSAQAHRAAFCRRDKTPERRRPAPARDRAARAVWFAGARGRRSAAYTRP